MYYSLVIRADESQPMLAERMFEGTDPLVTSRFQHGNEPDLIELFRYPVILTKEFRDGDTATEAVIGYMDQPSMNPSISFPLLRFPASALVDQGILTGKWPGSRTRWMVFEGDPYRKLSGAVKTVVPTRTPAIKSHQAAVMMPFGHHASIDPVYHAIEKGAGEAGFESVRVDQLMTPTEITDDIRNLICESQVVVVDLSGMNSNVMYELGFAHGKDKQVILITSDPLENLPFDIRSYRVLKYHKDSQIGLTELSGVVASAMKSIG